MLGLQEHYSPSPLGGFNGLFEGQIGVSFKYDIEIWLILNGLNASLKCKFVSLFAGKSKLNAVPTSQ